MLVTALGITTLWQPWIKLVGNEIRITKQKSIQELVIKNLGGLNELSIQSTGG